MAPQIVSPDAWLEARKALLVEEKAFTRARDALAVRRRALPWTEVTKPYRFEGPDGPLTLGGLFGGKSQLFLKHFMFAPDWEEGCTGCSFECDHIEGALPHLAQKDVAVACVSRAAFSRIDAFRRRMGWSFLWVSSGDGDFNYDFHVTATAEELTKNSQYYNYAQQNWATEELSGVSVFVKNEDGRVFHAYSSFGRGFEEVLSTYAVLDIMPKGREEAPGEGLSTWVKLKDSYGAGGGKACCD